MEIAVQITDGQKALFQKWARNTGFVLDIYDRPKRQFNVLAQQLGWIGGQEPWNARWKKCFEQDYIWRGDGTTLLDNADELTGLPQTIWACYAGFTPNPAAEFVEEFARLAEHQEWDEDEQRELRPKFIEAEFESYYGNNSKSVRNWRKLCRVCLIEPLPKTVDDCIMALKSVLVNIVNFVNNRRTGEPVLIFPTKRQFIDYTYPDRTYPLNRAIGNALMASLLQPVSSKKYERTADKEFEDYIAGRGCDHRVAYDGYI